MTLIYAHRGANREAAENTRPAFEKALHYSIDGIETDVQLSRDEVAVLWHDRYLGKLGLPGKHIDDFNLEALQAMSCLMTLKDFLAEFKDRCGLLIEIKNRAWESRERQELKVRLTLELIGPDRLLVSSFNLDSLTYAHSLRGDIALILNLEQEQTNLEQLLSNHPFLHGLCLPIASLNEANVHLLRDHKKCVAVYTCNSDEEISLALSLGVDILISDLPQKALSMRDK